MRCVGYIITILELIAKKSTYVSLDIAIFNMMLSKFTVLAEIVVFGFILTFPFEN